MRVEEARGPVLNCSARAGAAALPLHRNGLSDTPVAAVCVTAIAMGQRAYKYLFTHTLAPCLNRWSVTLYTSLVRNENLSHLGEKCLVRFLFRLPPGFQVDRVRLVGKIPGCIFLDHKFYASYTV
jgi:hypothetical protein